MAQTCRPERRGTYRRPTIQCGDGGLSGPTMRTGASEVIGRSKSSMESSKSETKRLPSLEVRHIGALTGSAGVVRGRSRPNCLESDVLMLKSVQRLDTEAFGWTLGPVASFLQHRGNSSRRRAPPWPGRSAECGGPSGPQPRAKQRHSPNHHPPGAEASDENTTEQ